MIQNRTILLLISLVVVFSSCSKKEPSAAGGPRMQAGTMSVEGFLVEQHQVSDDIEVPGSLLPAEETDIRAETSGRVVQINFREGAFVAAGVLLVKLFDEDLQAQLRKLEVQLQIAAKTEERQRELLNINGISQQDYDLSALQVENLKADIQSVRIAISKTEIRSPYAGKLGLRNISLGAFVSPTEILTTIRQVENLKLEFAIPEKYAKEVVPGSVVKFKVDGGREIHTGTVIATESGVDRATRTLRVRARVNARHSELVPGIFARVSLQLGKDTMALLVPSQAIIPQARGKQLILFRSDSVQFVNVETGIRDSSFVQVLNGVKRGDTIVTTGLMAIRPKAKVVITKMNRYPK